MQKWTIWLFRNSRADSAYIASVVANSERDAIEAALDELMARDREDDMNTRRKSVILGAVYKGSLDSSWHPAHGYTAHGAIQE